MEVQIARVALADSYIQQKPRRHGSSGTYDSIVVEPGLVNGHHNKQQVHQ
jgi:hypothetical protein